MNPILYGHPTTILSPGPVRQGVSKRCHRERNFLWDAHRFRDAHGLPSWHCICAPVAAADNDPPNAPAVKNSDAMVPTKPHDSAASPQPVVPPAASEEPSSVGPATTPAASETPVAQDREGPAAEAGGRAPDRLVPGLPVPATETDRRVEVFALQQPMASQVAEVLNDVLHGGGRGADSEGLPPTLTAIPLSPLARWRHLTKSGTSSSSSTYRNSGRLTWAFRWRRTTLPTATKILHARPPACPLLRRRR